jgi:uncharacterized membrane protein YfcA
VHIDIYLVLGSAVVGLLVGLTGMGGGALMTPMLVLLFGVTPSAAIASDLMAAFFMKPAGVFIHWRRKTVNTSVVRYLCYGSVPAAFFGTYVMHLLGQSVVAEHRLQILLGTALIIGSVAIFYRSVFVETPASGDEHVKVRPLPTVFIGIVGGFMVGLTSVGAGSLILVLLVMVYPTLSNKQLVGTDLAQSLPLTFSAALGTLMFGHVELGLTSSIVIGSVPAVIVGSLLSSRSNGYLLRRVITGVVLLSGLKYVGVPVDWLGIIGALEIVLITFLTIRHRRRTRDSVVEVSVPETVERVVTLLPTGLDGDL